MYHKKNSYAYDETNSLINEDSPPSYFDSVTAEDLKNNPIQKNRRYTFIRKVYFILCMQLAFTSGICGLFIYNDTIKNFVQGPNGGALLISSFVLQLVFMLVLVCTDVHRKYPYNYIILSLFTISMSYMLGVVTSTYDTNTVLLAAGATGVVTLGLTLFAFQTKIDFTGAGPYLFSGLLILIFMGFMGMFIHDRIYDIIYAGLGAFIFSFYIIYDTQLIIGGKHKKYQFRTDEHVFAALNLYLDIINLFLYLLRLLSDRR